MTSPSAPTISPPQQSSSLNPLIAWFDSHRKSVMLLLLALFAIQISPNFRLNPDGISYMSMAHNLAARGTFLRMGSPHLRYAPGYAVLITPAYLTSSPRPFIAIQLIQFILIALLILASWAWLSRYNPRMALWVTALILLNVSIWDLYRKASSEIAFLPAIVGASYLLGIAAQTQSRSTLWKSMLAATITVMIACSIRQVGIFLAPGFGMALLISAIRRKISWLRAILCTATVGLAGSAVVMGLLLYDQHTSRGKSTMADPTYIQLADQSTRLPDAGIIEGIRREASDIGRLVTPGLWTTFAKPHQWLNPLTLLYLLVCIPVLIGWWRFTRQTLDPLALTFPFYIAFFIYLPYEAGTRYTMPMVPVLAASLWYFFDSLSGRLARDGFAVLLSLHLVASVGAWINNALKDARMSRDWPAMEHAAAIVPIDQGIVIERGLDDNKTQYLMYLTDRPILDEKWSDSSDPSVIWVLSPITRPDTPGFHSIYQLEGIKLERRDDSATRSASSRP